MKIGKFGLSIMILWTIFVCIFLGGFSVQNAEQQPQTKSVEELRMRGSALSLVTTLSSSNKTFSALCDRTAGSALLELWRAQRIRETITTQSKNSTTPGATVVDTYAFPWHEYTPTVVDCQHCALSSIFSNETQTPVELEGMSHHDEFAAEEEEDDHVYLRLWRYQPIYGNPYEGFHALLTAFVVMKMLHLTPNATQIVFLDKWNASYPADRFLWSALSDFPTLSSSRSKGVLAVRNARVVSITSTTSTSLLCTKDAFGILNGRGIEHQCNSPLYTELIDAIQSRASGGPDPPVENVEDAGKDIAVQVVWVQRRGKVVRKLHREEEFLATLQMRLNQNTSTTSTTRRCPGFNIKAMDFASMKLEDIVNTVSSSTNAVVGIHGAGLMFGSFLKQRHYLQRGVVSTPPLLVEVFCFDRPSSNKHYHNMVSLMAAARGGGEGRTQNNKNGEREEVSVEYQSVDVNDHFPAARQFGVGYPDWFNPQLDNKGFVQWSERFVDDVVSRLLDHFCSVAHNKR